MSRSPGIPERSNSVAGMDPDLHTRSDPWEHLEDGLLWVQLQLVVLDEDHQPDGQLLSGEPVADALPDSATERHELALPVFRMINRQIDFLFVAFQEGVVGHWRGHDLPALGDLVAIDFEVLRELANVNGNWTYEALLLTDECADLTLR